MGNHLDILNMPENRSDIEKLVEGIEDNSIVNPYDMVFTYGGQFGPKLSEYSAKFMWYHIREQYYDRQFHRAMCQRIAAMPFDELGEGKLSDAEKQAMELAARCARVKERYLRKVLNVFKNT